LAYECGCGTSVAYDNVSHGDRFKAVAFHERCAESLCVSYVVWVHGVHEAHEEDRVGLFAYSGYVIREDYDRKLGLLLYCDDHFIGVIYRYCG
jgi:hypothetical protein